METFEMNTNKTAESQTAIADSVSAVSLAGNILLALGKLAAGIFAHSSAMVSDAIHSASDVFSTIIVIIGIRLSARESDKEHPYGHERLECVAALILSMLLFVTGFSIGVEAVRSLIRGADTSAPLPGVLALAAAIVSIIGKEAMYRYTCFYAKQINSSALMADAWHHRSDALSSIGALIGIAGTRLGFWFMDSAASLVIFLFIAKAAVEIFKDAVDKMVDHSCDEQTEQQLREFILSNPSVLKIDLLYTRIFGNRIYADVEISVDASISLREAHSIAEAVHEGIEQRFPTVKHITVHVNPSD